MRSEREKGGDSAPGDSKGRSPWRAFGDFPRDGKVTRVQGGAPATGRRDYRPAKAISKERNKKERRITMQVELQTIKEQVTLVANRLLEVANLRAGDVFVLGCSSSEICGGQIGKASSAEVGQTVIEALLPILKEKGLYLAVQGCEHINRALVIERAAAEKYGFEIVTVKPALHAGGACSVAAYERFDDPVMVEHVVARAGIDIGDTFIGQHIKHVQIPVRVGITEIGGAHVTCVRSRPKLIGGPRAQYPD